MMLSVVGLRGNVLWERLHHCHSQNSTRSQIEYNTCSLTDCVLRRACPLPVQYSTVHSNGIVFSMMIIIYLIRTSSLWNSILNLDVVNHLHNLLWELLHPEIKLG